MDITWIFWHGARACHHRPSPDGMKPKNPFFVERVNLLRIKILMPHRTRLAMQRMAGMDVVVCSSHFLVHQACTDTSHRFEIHGMRGHARFASPGGASSARSAIGETLSRYLSSCRVSTTHTVYDQPSSLLCVLYLRSQFVDEIGR